MKRIFVLLTLLLALTASALPYSGASAAQVQNYPAALAYYDAQINVLLPRLDNFQGQYFATNGRYYQALTSHMTAPDVPTVPDGIEVSPTDQDETLAFFWDAFAELPDVLAWSFSIDTYSGPDGDGYVLNITTVVNGETWTRSINNGPDDWRAADWYQLIQE